MACEVIKYWTVTKTPVHISVWIPRRHQVMCDLEKSIATFLFFPVFLNFLAIFFAGFNCSQAVENNEH